MDKIKITLKSKHKLFPFIKNQIPAITRKSGQNVMRLVESGLVTQEDITETLFKYYKSRYPYLSNESKQFN